ncbi:SIMPL domain-containing protein [Algibacter miyuki]|uniref:SIMPL domain-containing protein n=1 Tax=Algibacter miyuki TaxID=1306933 RepID=A0ABV5H279_9FLAO|nr:SIMPL domain-containing protein [Algibacter miyuki]MDN3666416.1 SIMPL domain-containing protein [Algibacter miyuki]
MKKFILFAALLFTLPFIAQEHKNTITVIGETKKTVQESGYTVLIGLQQVIYHGGQQEVEATSLADVTKNYADKLADLRIDFSRFRRNTYYELAMSYSQNRESAYYSFTTDDIEEVRKIIQLNLAGMTIVYNEVLAKELTNDQLVELSEAAIANAKLKAKAIAKKMNKTVGDIVNISDSNTNEQYIQNYGIITTQPYDVTVVFELN